MKYFQKKHKSGMLDLLAILEEWSPSNIILTHIYYFMFYQQ